MKLCQTAARQQSVGAVGGLKVTVSGWSTIGHLVVGRWSVGWQLVADQLAVGRRLGDWLAVGRRQLVVCGCRAVVGRPLPMVGRVVVCW